MSAGPSRSVLLWSSLADGSAESCPLFTSAFVARHFGRPTAGRGPRGRCAGRARGRLACPPRRASGRRLRFVAVGTLVCRQRPFAYHHAAPPTRPNAHGANSRDCDCVRAIMCAGSYTMCTWGSHCRRRPLLQLQGRAWLLSDSPNHPRPLCYLRHRLTISRGRRHGRMPSVFPK